MPTYSRAGQFGPAAIPGAPRGVALRVVDASGSDAVLYRDASKNKAVGPIVYSDDAGNVTFVADPGTYTVRWTGGSTSVAVSGGTADTTGDAATTNNQPKPGDYGWLAWTQDVKSVSTTSGTPDTGKLYFCRVPLRTPSPASGAVFISPTSAGAPTTAEVSLWTPDGIRRAVSANVNTDFSTSGVKTVPFASPYVPAVGIEWLWVGILQVGASLANLVRASSVSSQILNPNVGLASAMFAVAGTGLSATPSSVTPGSLVAPASGEGWWTALY